MGRSAGIRADGAGGRAWAWALLVDAAFVVVFAAVGRASHDEGVTAGGVAETAWPFLVALAVGWAVSLAWRAPLAVLRAGVPIWIATVAGGMLLRLVAGAGTALPFVIVATLTLLVLLVGWRGVVRAVVRRRGRARGARAHG